MTDASVPSDAPSASELRHRMANTLQLLSALARMRAQRASEPEVKRQLAWLADAIGSVGALEPKRQGARVDLGAYLRDMAPVWRRRHGAKHIDVEVDAAPFLAVDSTASSLALIAQELVANALTHGFADGRPGRVTVRLGPAGDGAWALTVADDGQGFDPESPQGRGGIRPLAGAQPGGPGARSVGGDLGAGRHRLAPVHALVVAGSNRS